VKSPIVSIVIAGFSRLLNKDTEIVWHRLCSLLKTCYSVAECNRIQDDAKRWPILCGSKRRHCVSSNGDWFSNV